MRTTGDVMQTAMSDLCSYLTHWLEDFDEVNLDVPTEGPGRALYLNRINEIKAAVQALAFVEAVVHQKPNDELLPAANQLHDALSTWLSSLSESYDQQE
jgi:hypothetical protein